MKLFGYTVGQMAVIGIIALVALYLFKEVDKRVNIPGFHQVVQGS